MKRLIGLAGVVLLSFTALHARAGADEDPPIVLEESVVTGGFGSGVLEAIEDARLTDPAYRDVAVRIVGIPADTFVDHGSVEQLRRLLRLDAVGISDQIREALARMGAAPSQPAGTSSRRKAKRPAGD